MLPILQTNDTVYICAPAKAIDPQSISFAKSNFEQNGYSIELSENVLGQYNYFSGTEAERLKDLQFGLDHPTAKVILCARGGYGCIQLLEKLNWTKFKKNPKWIIGFSDITVLHLALSKMDIPSLHATMPLNFEKNSKESFTTMYAALENKKFEIYASSSKHNQFGKVKAKVVGGNLAIVHAMLPYLNKDFFKNKILFLEDVGEHLYQIDRMFFGLKFIGALDNVAGIIIGGFTSISDTSAPFGYDLQEIISSHTSHRNIPVGFNFPSGHLDDNQAIILGRELLFEVGPDGSSIQQN
ncbi:MAG: S66 peptidase family protein [Bacteroidota bacterium]